MKWLKGLIAALVGGAAQSITVMVVDPADFNLTTGWHKLLNVMVVGSIVSAAMYLKQSPVPPDDDPLLRRIARSAPLVFLVLAGLVSGSCASARGVAILADKEFAAAVFALDDAEWAAYQTHVLTDAQHASLNPAIKKALVDVKAVTAALQAAPRGSVPASLPDLLADLNDVGKVIQALQPLVPTIALRASDANGKAIALLQTLIGGK